MASPSSSRTPKHPFRVDERPARRKIPPHMSRTVQCIKLGTESEGLEKPPFKGGLAVSNKIVIVGPMAEIFHDVHATPFGETPGPEIQAQIMAALLQGDWLTETTEQQNFWLALSAMVLALLICLGIPQALLKGLLLAGATVGLLVGCQMAFSYGDCVVVMMPPLFCLVATGSFGIIFEYTMEQLERRRYRNVLDRYVSKNVAKTILNDRRSFQEALKGRKQPVTVLFSDIRGFTTMTESSDADKLVVTQVAIDCGPVQKRWLARSMGRANRIIKRTSHVTVVVDIPE